MDDVIKVLLDKGADVNAKDNYGWTALMSASCLDRVYIARKLMAKGANVNAKNNEGKTALMYANTQKMIQLLNSAGR